MNTPKVTEIRRSLAAVTPDSFLMESFDANVNRRNRIGRGIGTNLTEQLGLPAAGTDQNLAPNGRHGSAAVDIGGLALQSPGKVHTEAPPEATPVAA